MFSTLLDLIDGLQRHGANPAVLAMRRKAAETWTYADLAVRVESLAGSLAGMGIGKDDPVALLSDNRLEWIAGALAVIRSGAVIVPIDVQAADDTLRHILRDSGAPLLFTTTTYAGRLQEIKKTDMRLVLLDTENDPRSWRKLPPGDQEKPAIEPQDRATLFYTSGTTGPPKGVPLSHGNIASQLNAIVAAEIAFEGDRVLLPLPLHHVYPFVFGMLAPLSLGLPIILPRALTGPQVAAALREGKATIIMGVPRLYSALDAGIRERFEACGRVAAGLYRAGIAATTWARRRLGLRPGRVLRPLRKRIAPDLRLLVSGGAALDEGLALRLEGLGWEVASGYGLTETSPMLTWNLPGRAKLDSAGAPVPGVELRISETPTRDTGQSADEADGSPAAPGDEFGEVMAKGPGVFSGYHHLPEKTAEAFTEDGWFRTGDLGYLDADGYLHIVGRVSTMIVTEGGENVDPETVEEAHAESPAIREIGVLERNRRLVALVVPQGGEGEPERAAEEALAERSRALPSYQRISDYAVTREPLSRTRLGKLRRHLLEERFDRAKEGRERPEAQRPVTPDEMSPEDRALLNNSAAREVWDWLAAHYSDRRLSPGASLQVDLGIDSMDWLNLTLEIGQRTRVELNEEVIAAVETVRDLLREVGEAAEAGERFDASVLDDPEAALSDEEKKWLEPLAPSEARLARGLFATNRMLMRSLFRLRAEGLDRLPSRQVVFAPTHGSFLDPFVVAAALDRQHLSRTFWMGAADMAFGNPLTRRVSRLAQAVPIDTQRRFVSGLALAAAVLKRGQNLIWFPEGARSRSTELQEFKPGIGMLLERYPVPVVPVAIYGAHDAYPPGRTVPRLHPIRIAFGEALDPEKLKEEGHGEEAMHRITSALRRHTEELYRRVQAEASGRH